MTGGKGAHGGSRFIRHMRMKHALGLPYSYKMWPAKRMRGRDRRRGTWWDRKRNCIAIEGVDFAQDTQEGGADEFELIPDSDEEGVAKGSSLLGDDDEYVPETEPQDVIVSTITGPCANQGRQRLGTLLHEWKRLISDVENESGKVDMESAKVQMDSVKVEMESDKLEMCAKVQMDNVKLEKDTAKVEMDNLKLEKESVKVEMDSVKAEMDTGKELDHRASFSDIETDDEACWVQDGVDLRGHSQVEDDDFNEQGLLIVFVIRVRQLLFVKYDVNGICIHAKVMYDIIQGFLDLLVDHLNQMDAQRYHLVQKQGFVVLRVDHLNEMDAQHCDLV
ncbi:uncharacterized protein LOC8056041 isoform X1 [Sorghum bicolor]|uniref:uncharacterized protein LOC8056041 isoform X1 n=1 Tax=Sorghum bicolor TaxID=4558 RepID=UPI000B424EEC|nr:uncharacterized protein LOC8056041 isoform X1 [Sorghum bicolor]XP_021319526.1 uncharacterized protein LOC8056041 isoform X1 [Sorghum bicolor]XP_021319527.1 uncharacterized protein LOC8056041 isoform X1 [Sorghum bicolor]|eukprot:XP_021319525.1 uncharacterized protein LOC8056041 isoform X1 [Sorghum bicolor]